VDGDRRGSVARQDVQDVETLHVRNDRFGKLGLFGSNQVFYLLAVEQLQELAEAALRTGVAVARDEHERAALDATGVVHVLHGEQQRLLEVPANRRLLAGEGKQRPHADGVLGGLLLLGTTADREQRADCYEARESLET